MAALAQADPKRKYSWWWNSHISPKNSKWLQENLTDMDVKVKHMIKLIEEDADSFARRAEMYYKKRPELMKLVEEFYRAYRALAERYDHATGALRQAHRTMAEAFPNQIPMGFGDDSPAGFSPEGDPRTPDMPAPLRAMFDPEELQKDALGLSSLNLHDAKRNGGCFTDEPASVTTRKGIKQLNGFSGSGEAGRAKKGLNFHEVDNQGRNKGENDVKASVLSESERVGKAEAEIVALQNALTKLEAEKEASLAQYQESLTRLSNLESEVSRAQDESTGLNEKARKAEIEVQILKETLAKLETEREVGLRQYQECLDKITNLENNLSRIQKDAEDINQRASNSEAQAQALKEDLTRVESEKEAALLQYKQSLETISTLKEQLLNAAEESRRLNERAGSAEAEVEDLKQSLSKLAAEKDALALQYQQCLETIISLENKLSFAQEEAQKLKGQLEVELLKLKDAEERSLMLERSNQTLHSELESSAQKIGNQSQELTEKQKELGRFWTCIQEERIRFVEAETAFQTLQHLHSQSQEELRSLAVTLHSRDQILKNMETRKQELQDEVQKVKEENKGLNELKLSSDVSIKNLQDEILSLRETIANLEAEVELRVDQRNSLQQEIYCLKEELSDLTKKHLNVMEQVEAVGLDPDSFGSSVKELQSENLTLKDVSEKERIENVVLMEKLKIMENLVEKNDLLENSLSVLNVELEGTRGKVQALEESYQSLLAEKSVLVSDNDAKVSQLQIATENLEKLSEKTNFLENSLSDASAEMEGLRIMIKNMEASYLLLDNEKCGLTTERESLISQLDITRKSLEDLEKGYTVLEKKYLALEQEKDSTLQKMEELGISIDTKTQEFTKFAKLSETRMTDMDLHIKLLQKESQYIKKEYEGGLDKALKAQIEIFILQKCIKDLENNNLSLLLECQRIMEAFKSSEKLITNLEFETHEKQAENKYLFGRIKLLKTGLQQMFNKLEIDADLGCEEKIEHDDMVMNSILRKLEEMQISIVKIQDENHQSVIENSVLVALLRQLDLEAGALAREKFSLQRELKIQHEQFQAFESETQKLMEKNEKQSLEIKEGGYREDVLKTELENFRRQLLDLQGAHKTLLEDQCKVLDEKRSLMKSIISLEEEHHVLENESLLMFAEVTSQSSLSLIFKEIISEKFLEIKELSESLIKLHSINDELEEKVTAKDVELMAVKIEHSQLRESFEISRAELFSIRSVADQLTCEVANGKDLLGLKEKEVFEAEKNFNTVENERTELNKIVEDLKSKYDAVKVIKEDHEKQIFKLSGDYDRQSRETGCLKEANRQLETELQNLRQEIRETKLQEEKLSNELLITRNEAELWETQAGEFLGELQVSSVHEAILEGRAHELTEACQSLEAGGYSKDMEIDQLKDKVNSLEGENKGLNEKLAIYVPAIISLKDSISSLETHALSNAKLHKSYNEVTKDATMTDMHAESSLQTNEDEPSAVPEGFSDLQDAQIKIKSIEHMLMETQRLMVLENSDVDSKLEHDIRQIEETSSGTSLYEGVQTIRHVKELDNAWKQTQPHEISKARNDGKPKDIMLDQMSNRSSYGITRGKTREVDDRMLELWETTGQCDSIDLKVEKAQKLATVPVDHYQKESFRKQKSKNPSIESLAETEFSGDQMESSNRFGEPQQEGNKRKVLQRLDSDAQKLANLHITVQDLKRKVEITEESNKGNAIEHDSVKGQLEEADEAITKLSNINRKLVMNVENGALSFDERSAGSDGNGSDRRRRISEQARRGSEKIGRLQLQVQKIQFFLLKLDETSSPARFRIPERKTRVLLRDYLYGRGVRTSQKRKKKHFVHAWSPVQWETEAL